MKVQSQRKVVAQEAAQRIQSAVAKWRRYFMQAQQGPDALRKRSGGRDPIVE